MRSILVVEDEFDVQQVVADVLRDEGYEVSVCGNGRDALQRLRTHRPDVVVMDVMMPILSGMQTLEEMRKTPGLDEVPVILMSETSPRASTPRHWQAFLKKPFRLEQLLEAVARVSGVQGRA
ncbi:response regulator [Archangium gephyra]|uniref:response regulator n=1 Tax=Archangium gephyra TaxID=48 RepID=UPI003B825350